MLVECRTCGAEIDAPINSDLGAAQCGVCRQDGADSERWCAVCTQVVPIDGHGHFVSEDQRHRRIEGLSARVVEAAVELRDMHERVRSALRAMYAYIQGPCDCGVCAAVDAYLAAKEGR